MNRSSPFSLAADWGMAPLRLGVGLVFLMHGYQKLFVFGLDGATSFMAGVGIPAPQVAAVLVTALELLGGLALIVGLFTEWAALLLAGDMAVAILTVKLKGGFFAPQGAEFELTLLAAALTLAAMGPGGFSVDATRAAKSRSAVVLVLLLMLLAPGSAEAQKTKRRCTGEPADSLAQLRAPTGASGVARC